MTESTANQALNSYYENQVAEKQRWEKILAAPEKKSGTSYNKSKQVQKGFFSWLTGR